MGYPYSCFTSCLTPVTEKLPSGQDPIQGRAVYLIIVMSLSSPFIWNWFLSLCFSWYWYFLKMCLFLTVLGLHCWRAFSGCSEWGRLSSRAQASLAVAHGLHVHRLQESWHSSLAATWRVGSSWSRDEPMSLELAGGFLTTGPSGKPDTGTFQSMWAG